MTDRGGAGPNDDPQVLRAALRGDLVAAMKARQPAAVAALRSALAAIDNAEAVDVAPGAVPLTSQHVAGARTGVGSTEAPRRELSVDEVRTIIRTQFTERTTEADRYETYGQATAADAAARLRQEAAVLAKYVE